jgi:hypothetical protein
MSRRLFLRRLADAGLASSFAAWSSSCGSLLYPERVGQSRRGPIDPGVAILDGLGLLLFLVPGIIAFAVDFSTGALFLPEFAPSYPPPSPPGPTYIAPPVSQTDEKRKNKLVELAGDPRRMSRKEIERRVSEAIGQNVKLEPGLYQAEPLKSVDDFDSAASRLIAATTDQRTEVIFRCQSE